MQSNKIKLIIEEKEINYFVWWTIYMHFTDSIILAKYLGRPYKNQLVYYQNGDGNWATDLEAWNELGASLVDNIYNNNFDIQSLVDEHYLYGGAVNKKCRQILAKDISSLSMAEISDWLEKTIPDYLSLNELGFVAVISDVENSFLSDKLKEIVVSKSAGTNIQEILNKLSLSDEKNIFWQEEKELINLLVKYQDIDKLRQSDDFKNHVANYTWINFGYLGPAWAESDFVDRAKEILAKSEPKKLLKEHQEYLSDIKRTREKLYQDLKFSQQEKFVFQVARDFSLVKNYRVGVRYYFCYTIKIIFEELAKRLNMPIDVFYYASEDELAPLLQGKIKDYKNILTRKTFYCEYLEGKEKTVLSYEELEHIKKYFIKDKITDSDTISGQAAFLGCVRGKVKIVSGPKDIDKVKEGEILVAVYTDPNLLPAMKRASAFVTEQGGITSHAAIVAREMKKPCIIGTRIATKILKDGDMVEVDANNGIVKKI